MRKWTKMLILVVGMSLLVAAGCNKESNLTSPTSELSTDTASEMSQLVDSDLVQDTEEKTKLPEQINASGGVGYIRKSCLYGAKADIYSYGWIQVRFYRYGGWYTYWQGYSYGRKIFYTTSRDTYDRIEYSTPNNTGWIYSAGCR